MGYEKAAMVYQPAASTESGVGRQDCGAMNMSGIRHLFPVLDIEIMSSNIHSV